MITILLSLILIAIVFVMQEVATSIATRLTGFVFALIGGWSLASGFMELVHK